jgi:hypothetical protein
MGGPSQPRKLTLLLLLLMMDGLIGPCRADIFCRDGVPALAEIAYQDQNEI